MCLVCGLSQGSSVREHGDEPPDLGWLKLGRMKDGTRSVVKVRTFAEKGSGPLAEVEDMVAKTHRDVVLPGSSWATHRGKLLCHPVTGLGTPMI